MACETKLWFVFILMVVAYPKPCVHGEPQVPCYFIFGDSLADSGNNNNLETVAKVNYPPYGIDFPEGPTGRFTNGRTTPDITGEMLGFEAFIPPFRTANGPQILQGVNYASGSAGILEESGKRNMGENIELSKQVKNHQVTISRIVRMLGSTHRATDHLNKCFYSIVVGTNDYINNYFVPEFYNSSRQYQPEKYAELLIERYSQQIKILYETGARKVALSGILPLGCTPVAINKYGTNGTLCVDRINDAVNYFNTQLKSLVNTLEKDLSGAKFAYLSPLGIDIVSKYPDSPGVMIKKEGCCKTNQYGLCIPNSKPCPRIIPRIFWDALHPTQFANQIVGGLSYPKVKELISS